MRPPAPPSLLALVTAGLLLIPGCKKNGGDQDAAVDAGPDELVEGPVTKKDVGESCEADPECVSNICFGKICRKSCAGQSSCASNEDCGSDDGKRPSFCYVKSYAPELGQSCAVTGTCPDSMRCLNGGADAAAAYCAGECKDSTGCPPTMNCREFDDADAPGGKIHYCVRRGFCARCQHDGQCELGGKCVKQGKESFCTRPCHAGSTECPRTADCQDVGGGSFQCVHRTGSCVGDGTMCSPCLDEPDCQAGSLCLTFTFSHESFCATSCPTKGQPCEGSSSYRCEEIPLSESESSNQCVPYSKDPTKDIFCNPLSPTMEVGDVVPDFAMVGYSDENQSGNLNDERTAGKIKVVKVSDFASSKIILFNVSAGWCGPCMLETTGMAALMSKYRSNGLMIFQVLYDGKDQGEDPTRAFLNGWIAGKVNLGTVLEPNIVPLNPQGACGIDPNRDVAPWNTDGTTPLNIVLDGPTRRVIAKWNSIAPKGFASLEAAIRKHLGLGPLPPPDSGPAKEAGPGKDSGPPAEAGPDK